MNIKPSIETEAQNVVVPAKKKRTPKRFTSREQIIARIDKFTKKAERKRKEQKGLYAEIGILQRQMANRVEVITKMAQKETLADKLGRQADRLEKDVLPALKAKLAEFDTDVIPGITTDRSIPAV